MISKGLQKKYGLSAKGGRSISAAMNDLGLTERVILFSRFLKNHGFKVFSSSVVDALRCLEEGGVSDREDFFHFLRANFVSTDVEWKLFRDLFEEFWQNTPKQDHRKEEREKEELPECSEDLVLERMIEPVEQNEADLRTKSERESLEGAMFSPVALLEKRDLSCFDRKDIQVAQLILKNMMSSFRICEGRRFKRSKKPGDIHFRLILKKSLRAGGIPLELFYRRKKKRLKKLVILVDVSGSMDRYARFVMPFIMGLKGVGSRADVYVFSTSLTPITRLVRKLSIDKALEMISEVVPDWSGGTRIGDSLRQFNERFGPKYLNRRTIAVIISDGWDLGARNVLKREMETLARKVHSVLWLNPLAGDPEYKPLCRGMQTVLPYVDHFLAADSLGSLRRVGRTLSRVMLSG
jgi:uncharacterized protein with von Willebrand factor type A (vWA) domain